MHACSQSMIDMRPTLKRIVLMLERLVFLCLFGYFVSKVVASIIRLYDRQIGTSVRLVLG